MKAPELFTIIFLIIAAGYALATALSHKDYLAAICILALAVNWLRLVLKS